MTRPSGLLALAGALCLMACGSSEPENAALPDATENAELVNAGAMIEDLPSDGLTASSNLMLPSESNASVEAAPAE